MTPHQPTRDQLVAATDDAATFYRRQLLGTLAAGPRAYLCSRGFEALLDDSRWTVGYAPGSWTATRDHLAGLGYSDEAVLAAGLCAVSRRGTLIDRFRDRITFGIRDHNNHLIGHVARAGPHADVLAPRYLNTPATALYDKGASLFGYGEAVQQPRATVVLTEGPLDAIAVDLANEGARQLVPLACGGTALTPEHRRLIDHLAPTSVVLAFDDDPAGIKALRTAYRLLRDTADLHAVRWTNGTDPADVLSRAGPERLREQLTLSPHAADVIVDRHLASWPRSQTGAEADLGLLRETLTDVALMQPDDVARQVVRLTQRLPFDAPTVGRELTDIVSRGSAGPPPLAKPPPPTSERANLQTRRFV